MRKYIFGKQIQKYTAIIKIILVENGSLPGR